MEFEIINDVLINSTDKNIFDKGSKYYEDGYVKKIKYTNENKILTIEGEVACANSNIYNSLLSIDLKNKEIIDVNCNCIDYKSSYGEKSFCKHIVASALYVCNLLKSNVISNLKQNTFVVKNDHKIKKNKELINKELLDYFKSNEKEKVDLDIKVEYLGENTFNYDFKIGIDKMYVMKDLREFALCRLQSKSLVYGVDFDYNPINNYFEYENEKIVEMIEEYGLNLDNSNNQRDFKSMKIGSSQVRRLFKSLEFTNFDFKFRNMYYRPNVIEGNLPINFNLELNEDKVVLDTKDNLPYPLSLKGDVVFYKGDIYILNDENGIYYKKLYELLQEFKKIQFEQKQVSQVLTDVVPKLNNICSHVIIDESIKENISDKLKIKYYFDLEDSNITCRLHFDYYEKNKFIIKNKQKENSAIYALYRNFFELRKDKYVFKGNDEQLYDFLSKEINKLKEIGEVYYSDKLKEKKVYNSSAIKISLGEEINHYLEFDFEIEDVDKSEYKKIINAFKSKKRFYKLGNGNFINLEETETKETFKLMESLGFTTNYNEMKIHFSKAIYLDNLLREKKMPYISGKENIDKLIEKLEKVKSKKFDVSDKLHGKLRDYQRDSLNFFETLDYLGFGGILADEMGLGKTIQTISFLLNKENKKSLIVTPTSLIHNWKSEFEKFAPSLKVGISHGLKKDRLNLIKNKDDYDVILTTYGALRNDLDEFEKLYFDYCIIDEAQNIKNPLASVSDAVKTINAKSRFALSGTPIENNLLELWSIFDFIMPGYLYNLSKFNAVFIKDESQVENLKRMIQPFILRRTKKQVIKELPPKIEKQYIVEMDKSQKNAYGIYVQNVKEKLKEKEAIKNKITVFSYLTKLRQLCLDPSIVIEDYKGKSAKIDTCIEIIKENIQENNKILVFSQFTTVLKNLGEKLSKKEISYYYLDGATKAVDRTSLVNNFNEKDDIKVFLISLKAGGTGLNLTSANTVILFDPWWNPSVENQASDRAHRIGQKNVVEVIKLITKGTIEEKIVELQNRKKELIDNMINENLSNAQMLSSISEEEIIYLLQ